LAVTRSPCDRTLFNTDCSACAASLVSLVAFTEVTTDTPAAVQLRSVPGYGNPGPGGPGSDSTFQPRRDKILYMARTVLWISVLRRNPGGCRRRSLRHTEKLNFCPENLPTSALNESEAAIKGIYRGPSRASSLSRANRAFISRICALCAFSSWAERPWTVPLSMSACPWISPTSALAVAAESLACPASLKAVASFALANACRCTEHTYIAPSAKSSPATPMMTRSSNVLSHSFHFSTLSFDSPQTPIATISPKTSRATCEHANAAEVACSETDKAVPLSPYDLLVGIAMAVQGLAFGYALHVHFRGRRRRRM
jgi:hypothetical protein